ncbi:hypothetical protein NP233_g10758 [Leucocoprinus birnbaumii]|uniref:Uncharacterized protein n=1 Tax=Leucocoprinus birnbaumii TaxID=56174 RepID=A0AAD5VK54_9AGAR|nr:hypothetical protein NP233_g10758 [Leucocoprinus birnbaumii]
MTDTTSTRDVVESVEVRVFIEPYKPARIYEVPCINGEMNLYRNPELINDTGFPAVFQTMYDPSINMFAGMHHQSGTFQVDQSIPFWIMKEGNLHVDACPHIDEWCDIVEDSWKEVHGVLAEGPRTPRLPPIDEDSWKEVHPVFAERFRTPQHPPTSSPILFTDLSTPMSSSPIPALPSLCDSPTPISQPPPNQLACRYMGNRFGLAPPSRPSQPPLHQLNYDYLGKENHFGLASPSPSASPPLPASSDILGKRKREAIPFSIGSLGPFHISIHVNGKDIQVEQEVVDAATKTGGDSIPTKVPDQPTKVNNQAESGIGTQLKVYQDSSVQAGSEIIDLTISEDEGSGDTEFTPEPAVKKRNLRSARGKAKARRGRKL